MAALKSSEVWVADDDSSIRWVINRSLRKAGFEVSQFEDAESLLDELEQRQPQVVITDINMPGQSGLKLLNKLQRRHKNLPCIVMTAHTDLESALESYEKGAFEYLPKPFDLDEMLRLVNRALGSKPSKSVTQLSNLDMFGEAPAMQQVFRMIGRMSKSQTSVLILGANGTGKSLLAKTIHDKSLRASAPFVVSNIAAVPEQMLEQELFGYEQELGVTQGLLEKANQGTLYLHDIADLSLELQARLLRVITEQCFYRNNGTELVTSNVRLIVGTGQDLVALIAQNKFRGDLYHHLNVIEIPLPTLAERSEDIALLSRKFLQQSAIELGVEAKQFSPTALRFLKQYHWPGNVRQLKNICRLVTVLAPSKLVEIEDLPDEIRTAENQTMLADWESLLAKHIARQLSNGDKQVLNELKDKFEAIALRAALDYTGGHRQQAAKALGWGRNTLTRKLKELNVD